MLRKRSSSNLSVSVKARFTFQDIATACKTATEELLPELPTTVTSRLRLGRAPQRHGSDTRVFIYNIWDKHQPTFLDKRHFGYNFGYDPVLRYFREPLVINFYANRHRIYDKRELVIPALWAEMRKATKVLHNFEASENDQMINLFRHFDANDLDELKAQIHEGFRELIPYWHSRYAAVIDHYGCNLTREEVEETIAGRRKFQPSGPRPSMSEGQYSRNIPSKLRAKVLARDGRKCLKCGTPKNLHVDHIVPVSLGGLTVLRNLQTLCSDHNLGKGNRESVDYRKGKGRQCV